MARKFQQTAQETKYFRPEFQKCPHCQSKLEFCHSVSNKTVVTLEGVFKIVNMGYRCGNEQCSNRETVYRSAEAERYSMKYVTFGMDVLALIGQLRFKEHKHRGEIAAELLKRGIKTSERNVQKLYERYSLLLRASLDDHVKQALRQVVEDHKGIVLSIDGVQPEKGNETLYVIREVLSGTIVAAKNVKSSSTAELKEFIQPVLDLGFPILGFVSDGQLSIRKSIEELRPNLPYQYCQYHYLKDIAKPVVDKDRKLKTSIKKDLRGIRAVEKKANTLETLEAEVALDYAAAIRSVLLEDGKAPLDLPGMKVYERTKEIQDSLNTCLVKKGLSST
jgi:hypothetical protein